MYCSNEAKGPAHCVLAWHDIRYHQGSPRLSPLPRIFTSQQQEPLRHDLSPSYVFECVSADLFDYAGNSYLVYTDRLSGWLSIAVWYKRAPLSKEVIRVVRQYFATMGVPVRFKSDGGPQFASRDFGHFMSRWGVHHCMSSPHYLQSNGHAEAAMRDMKHLVAKTTANGNLNDDAFDEGLLEWRNTPHCATGVSPTQILFGHTLRSLVPTHHRNFSTSWQSQADTRNMAVARFPANSQTGTTLRPATSPHFGSDRMC